MKWYQDGKGNTSSMRIMAMIMVCTGSAISISGVVGFFLGLDGAAIVGTGTALAGASGFAKAWQAGKEQ